MPSISLPPELQIRFLTQADTEAYRTLRLESLQLNSNAFLTLYENESKLKSELFGNHLENALRLPYFGYFGAFVNGKLVGYVQATSTMFEKQSHIVQIYNVYITPHYRRRGFAKLLFEYIFDRFRQSGHLEQVYLTCTANNKAALRFYQQLGFHRYGIKRKAIKWQGVYDDEIELVKVL